MRAISSSITLLLCASCLSSAAWAFDPNAGAVEVTPAARYTPLPESVVPHRYYNPQVLSSAASSAAPVVSAAPQPAVIAPLPAVAEAAAPTVQRTVPAEQYAAAAAPAPTNYYAQPSEPAPMAAPVGRTSYIAPVSGNYYAQQPSYKTNSFSIGAEGFWDRYREDIADLESNSGYGALDASWNHYYSPNWYSSIELRGGYGKEDYKSVSGTLDGTDQWEFEGRMLAGYDMAGGNGSHFKTYLGIDTRYYRDEGKGGVTNLGFNAYDRRIFQVFLPIGMTYDIPTSRGYHFLPTIEGGPLLWGNVSTRLENIPGFNQLENQQHTGYEIRGDFMMSNLNEAGRGWEFGPFVRYYHAEDSGTDTIPAGTFLEPKNTRLQLGAKLGYLF